MRVYQFRHIHTALMDYNHLQIILQGYNQSFLKKMIMMLYQSIRFKSSVYRFSELIKSSVVIDHMIGKLHFLLFSVL